MTDMSGASYSGPLPPLSDEQALVRDNLKHHVRMLAGQIGERNVWHYASLQAADRYIQSELKTAGYGITALPFASRELTLNNIEAELPGSALPEEIVVVGAHYDSVAGSPGANDNGSGVAALLELARMLAQTRLRRSVRFVAFANEEPPFFYSEEMGSRIYATQARKRGERISAMIALETIGCYTSEAGSQHYPFPLRFFYPDSGDFIGFVGNLSSRRLVRRAIAAFRQSTPFPSQAAALPGWVTGVHWSDHWSFWKAGYPAIMVTDTALFRYAHYHSASDTPDKLDYASMARVVVGLRHVITELAEVDPGYD